MRKADAFALPSGPRELKWGSRGRNALEIYREWWYNNAKIG